MATEHPDPARLPLFVFGTLRRGQWNHHYLYGKYERMLPARLPGFARVETLMIARQAGGTVDGELYFIRPDIFEATLRSCDALEGIAPGKTAGPDYRRLQVAVETSEGPVTAWAYVRADTRE